MGDQYVLKKEVWNSFVNEVLGSYEFIAPVKGDDSKAIQKSMFDSITSSDQVRIEKGPAFFPAKNFFFDKKEVIFKFDGNNIEDPEIHIKQRVFFGLRKCDLNGIYHQDIVFLDKDHTDPFYKTRRDASILIGLHCDEGDEYCFCNSMELKDFYDLMFYDKDDHYAVDVGSEKGKSFVEKFQSFFEKADNIITDEDKKTKNEKLLERTDIKDLYQRDEWEEDAKQCLSCGACNHLCVNCHCFEIKDEVRFDLKTGERVRIPSSCQLRSFTRVAGDHIFRDERSARFKHRIYHQLQYFKERHDVMFCTGCGRCIRGCPARIDWVSTVNKMAK